jgi:alcohol dehydrogenase class IV
MRFEFATASSIIFGPGTIQEVAPRAAQLGRRVFMVTGHSINRAAPLLEQLKKQNLESFTFHVSEEPTTNIASLGVQQAREAKCDIVIGLGGGSAIDTGKVIAALLTNRGELTDYLEVIGGRHPLENTPSPYIAIPTTAGTGAEVTRNAVLTSPEHHVKVSMRSPLMLPCVAVVDPLLTLSMPPDLTASTGLDALTQLMEAFVTNESNPLTDGICREGLRRATRSLRQAYEDGGNLEAREDMCVASLFSGLALANAKLGAVHGIAGPLGGMVPAPHGVLCARLLPSVIEANVLALQSRAPASPALSRYNEVAKILTGNSGAQAAEGISWIQHLCNTMEITPLAEFGLREADFLVVVEKSKRASSMKGNPITLTDTELTEILSKAL